MSKSTQWITILLITLLSYSFVPSVFAASVPASTSTTLGSTWNELPDEVGNCTYATQRISEMGGGYLSYDCYGAGTTQSSIYSAAMGNGAPRSISFYIGHGGYDVRWDWITQNKHWKIKDNNGGDVWDEDIFGQAGSNDTSFVFLWNCEGGDTIGGTYGGGYEYGMPYAWLRTTSLSNDGYANSDTSNLCFIGFSGIAPELTNYAEQFGYPGALEDFLIDFYQTALNHGLSSTVNSALDNAAQEVWQVPYSNCVLREGYIFWEGKWVSGAMVVYGDGNMQLTPVNPLFGMKTLADGFFYKPNQPFQFVKVEEWFTSSNAEGDQYGLNVNGYPFQFPDSHCDMKDISFLVSLFNKHEGQTGWNYMGDVNHDHVCNMMDIAYARQHYGSGTWYSTDLSDMSIVFNFADGSQKWLSVDSYGFIAAPWNCTNWYVYLYDFPVGALLSFWG